MRPRSLLVALLLALVVFIAVRPAAVPVSTSTSSKQRADASSSSAPTSSSSSSAPTSLSSSSSSQSSPSSSSSPSSAATAEYTLPAAMARVLLPQLPAAERHRVRVVDVDVEQCSEPPTDAELCTLLHTPEYTLNATPPAAYPASATSDEARDELLMRANERKLRERARRFLAGSLRSPMQADVDWCWRNYSAVYTRFVRASRDAIVYLGQRRKHATYGRDTFGNMRVSLELLYRRYPAVEHADVIVFTEVGAFTDADMAELTADGARSNVRFVELFGRYWTHDPPCVRDDEFLDAKFPRGYRRMIRLYTLGFHHLLYNELGYTHMMRMDEESFLHSTLRYNVFTQMREHGWYYGYRIPCNDQRFMHPTWASHFNSMVDAFFEAAPRRANFTDDADLVPLARARQAYHGHGYWGAYNNWYVTTLEFWHRPLVRALMYFQDAHAGTLYFRWNDIETQQAAVNALLPAERVRLYDDFSYEHATLGPPDTKRFRALTTQPGQLMLRVGGIVLGKHDNETSLRKFADEWLVNFGSRFHHGRCLLRPMKPFTEHRSLSWICDP